MHWMHKQPLLWFYCTLRRAAYSAMTGVGKTTGQMRVTPAMAAGVVDRLWTLDDLLSA